MKIFIINGPNLNLLGVREKSIYGSMKFEDYLSYLENKYFNIINFSFFQTNHEGYIIDKLHEFGFTYDGIILNPGAYAHYSYSISDAIKSICCPVIEVHISNIFNREYFRRLSVISNNCLESIIGFGLEGYEKAVEYLIKYNKIK